MESYKICLSINYLKNNDLFLIADLRSSSGKMAESGKKIHSTVEEEKWRNLLKLFECHVDAFLGIDIKNLRKK